MEKLIDPIQLGSIHAKNRIFMSAMTRARATKEHVPTKIMAEYYAQRAGAGLIFTEATGISREGLGWPYAPGIWTKEQIEGWKPVTKAVHDKGGKIVLQLWHMGRALHSSVTGLQPVSASATTYQHEIHTYNGKEHPEEARALTHEDIKRIVKDFAQGARNAIEAGFDGVQVQGGNGYLVDQFLRDSTNHRTDEYGGSVANRSRFFEEIVDAVVDAVGADRTSVRLSPNGDSQGVIDSDPEPLFTHVAKYLETKNLAFVELREINPKDPSVKADAQQHGLFRKYYTGPLGLNEEYDRERSIKTVNDGTADFVVIGRPFLYNPDLVQKWVHNDELTPLDYTYAYVGGEKGYTDIPTKY